jgi:hypothetical protein
VISYLDTSLLVKLYINEAGSAEAIGLLSGGDLEPIISWLSEVEMAAALEARPIRTSSSNSETQLRFAYEKFRAEIGSGIYRVIPVDSFTFDLAGLWPSNMDGALESGRSILFTLLRRFVTGQQHSGRLTTGRGG